VEGNSLNDKPRLAKVASETLRSILPELEHDTITAPELLNFLQSNQGREEIERALQRLYQLGIHSIPKYIIEGQTIVDGAAHSKVFVNTFRSIERRGKVARGPVFGEILGVDENTIQQGSHWEIIDA